jgi:hypothetical protein
MTITMTTLAAAFVAALASAASAAEGEYYEGAGSAASRILTDSLMTGSIGLPAPRHVPVAPTVDSGDFYPGVERNR